jgi:uracil-DNA glycosylase family 4
MPRNDEIAQLYVDIREQVRYLQELGVDSLNIDLKQLELLPASLDKELADIRLAPPPAVIPRPAPAQLKVETKPFTSRLGSLPTLSDRPVAPTKREIPGDRTSLANMRAAVTAEPDQALFGDVLPTLPEPIETIEQIRADIGAECTRCKLCSLGRSRVVNSVGNFNADLMFVGEAPGADEDEQGERFVGRAGQLLTKIIEGIGIKREQVFIGNINRCRPPQNRAPESDESVVCKPFLLREIAVVRPKVIVVLGATAAQNLLETKVPIGKLRGHFHDYQGVKVMPTFHPAYLLRDPHKKREVWEDMKLVRDYLKQF